MSSFFTRAIALIISTGIFTTSFSQELAVEVIASGVKSSLRGLSVVNDNVIWVSGSGGTVGKSSNGGKTWKWITVPGFEKTEFRDIEAFDAKVAIVLGIGEPAYILKTNDGGETWKVVYENRQKGMFLDAMDFATPRHGIVVGDPINGKAFIARTSNSGNTWEEMSAAENRVALDSGEAFFAASGSNVKLFENGQFYLVSGGLKSRLTSPRGTTPLDLLQGTESTGANAIDIFDGGVPIKPGKRMVIVGGDFAADSSTKKNCLYSTDGGKTWKTPLIPPHGYRSGVEFISEKDILACGLNGVDYSEDGGKTWKLISKEGFHVVKIARVGRSIFFAGNKGRIAKISLVLEEPISQQQ
ncbi:oxidoreductase [Terrimonas sp. NA20]|uniref:Oxidoreductase n=1 Tax=Terrimonas ginsenosidimutans TaxID=2908004 RepID=A0ABS9KXF9_9BACT|nr:oxidoreductase [Terrimonas ginsenosidimutans]MCG2617031.1 oxidoreductase [Terrimonas ginsenosidimutans]